MEMHNNIRQTVTIEDEIEVIDLDSYLKTSEDVVNRWDKQIQSRICEDLVGGSEQQLKKFLQEYKRSLKEEASLFSDKLLVKSKILTHIRSICFCCSRHLSKRSHWTAYLDHFEDVLAEYCALELNAVQHLKRRHSNSYDKCETGFMSRCSTICRHLCSLLSVCLKNSEEHILHVLIKLRYNTRSAACREIMHGVYSYFLAELPQQDFTDEAFCRYYLVLKKWEQIQKSESHPIMEKIMYRRMKRPEDCMKNDESIQTILGIRCLDSVAIFSLITDNNDVTRDAYFHYIKNKAIREYESDSSLIINSDEENGGTETVVINDDDDDDIISDDDEVQIVHVTTGDPINISDDEDDDIVVPPDKSVTQDQPSPSTSSISVNFTEEPVLQANDCNKNQEKPQENDVTIENVENVTAAAPARVTTIEVSHIEYVAEEQIAIEIEQPEDVPLHYEIEEHQNKPSICQYDTIEKQIEQQPQNEREKQSVVVSTQTESEFEHESISVANETSFNADIELCIDAIIEENKITPCTDLLEQTVIPCSVILQETSDIGENVCEVTENCIETDMNQDILAFQLASNTVIVAPDCNQSNVTTNNEPSQIAIVAMETDTATPQIQTIEEELAPLISIPKTKETRKSTNTSSSFSISRLIEDDGGAEGKQTVVVVPFDISDPNLDAIMNEETVETSQQEMESMKSMQNFNKLDGLSHTHTFDNMPIWDDVIAESSKEKKIVECTNGKKLKPALKQTTNNGLTTRITYTSEDTLKVPLTKHLNFEEEMLMKGENVFSEPITRLYEYHTTDEHKSNFGNLQKENKRKATIENEPKQKRTKFTEEKNKCYIYSSGQTVAPSQLKIKAHKPSFAAYNISVDDSKLRGKRKRLEVIVSEMALEDMKAHVEKKKRLRYEKAKNRLKEEVSNPRIVATPRESLIRERFNYIDATPPEPSSRLVLPRTNQETTTTSVPLFRSEANLHNNQKGNHSGDVVKTAQTPSRKRKKVNGEKVGVPVNMDSIFDSLRNGIAESSFHASEKGDKT